MSRQFTVLESAFVVLIAVQALVPVAGHSQPGSQAGRVAQVRQGGRVEQIEQAGPAAQAGQRATASAKARTPPRALESPRDLQGIWTNATMTPLERPADLA